MKNITKVLLSTCLLISTNLFSQTNPKPQQDGNLDKDLYKKLMICIESADMQRNYLEIKLRDRISYKTIEGMNGFSITTKDCDNFYNGYDHPKGNDNIRKAIASKYPEIADDLRMRRGHSPDLEINCGIFSGEKCKEILPLISQDQKIYSDNFYREIKIIENEKERQRENKRINEERARVAELRGRNYSRMPAKFNLRIQEQNIAVVTSIDNDPFLLERVVFNNRVGVEGCDNGPYAEYMSMGDGRRIAAVNCGDSIIKIDVFTNRGNLSFRTK